MLRVSDQSRYANLVASYGSLLSQQNSLQQQISSGQRLNHAGDDPTGFGLLQRAGTENARVQQDLTNISQAQSFSTAADSSLQSVMAQLQQASALGISAGDSTLTQSDRTAIASHIDGILKGVLSDANQTYQGQALFSGTKTQTLAFQAVTDAAGNITGATYGGDGNALKTEDAPGETLAYSLSGSNAGGNGFGVFQDSNAGIDVFSTLATLRNDVVNNPAALTADLQNLTQTMNHVSLAAAKNGGIGNTLSTQQTNLQDRSVNLTQTISGLGSTDIAGAVTQLQGLQVAYQASLAMGARVGDISLLNYLR